jgi:hypothetical protein
MTGLYERNAADSRMMNRFDPAAERLSRGRIHIPKKEETDPGDHTVAYAGQQQVNAINSIPVHIPEPQQEPERRINPILGDPGDARNVIFGAVRQIEGPRKGTKVKRGIDSFSRGLFGK